MTLGLAQKDFETARAQLDRSARNKSGKASKLTQKALKAQRQERWADAVNLLLEVSELQPANNQIWVVVAFCLSQLGQRAKAIETLEHILARSEPTEQLVNVMGHMAADMEMFDVSEKLWHHAIAFNPKEAEYHAHLAAAMMHQERYDDAIAYLQKVLPIFPENVALWNVAGLCARAQRKQPQARQFFQEALKINPNDYRALNNYSMIAPWKERPDLLRRGIALRPTEPELHVGLAFELFMRGELAQAYPEYEWRLDKNRESAQVVQYAVDAPRWRGEDLTGKTVLVMNEQGLGDEILFSFLFDRLKPLAGEVLLTCDSRLTDAYERNFECPAYASQDFRKDGYRFRHYPGLDREIRAGERGKPDYCIPAGSLMQHFWHEIADMAPVRKPVLGPDPERAAFWRDRLSGLTGKLRIGLAWTSQRQKGMRRHRYLSLEDYAPLFEVPGLEFVSLQYTDCEEEIRDAEARFGVTIHRWDDVDLKKDIEANLAIMSNLDLFVGPSVAPSWMALAVGLPTYVLVQRHYAFWWHFGQDTDCIAFDPDHSRMIESQRGKDLNFKKYGPLHALEALKKDFADRLA
ncbi:tetratricopeptide repeat protein [Yunchengibacter salinarum]|uniref:tetratricopeptide repeat protein n=1 Tax=Yunchengibacter salinarum TaxID=3133399 RepID=UPI0035B5DA10